LYGAAIRENSVNTAAGIQKLSEMMRFMLHENHQPSIPLKKEIDYTRNYIELQLLRVGTSPKLVVESEITGDSAALSIAPMILIPFIENAFKHGISRRHQSWIKVKLSLKEKRLHFTVVNSIHERSFRAPEERSGVGLENVMQRLSLSYHQKHELSIDAKPNEFIVDLTIDLSV
jgi:LytS/YehU family sensor histidine kinase